VPAAAIVSLVLVALLVVALAGYLIWVVLLLRRIVDTLGKVTFGVRAIAHRAEPIAELLDDVNAELDSVARAVDALVVRAEPVQAASPR
jgi:cobalamin biosynthesis protein CobD/CbiB